MDVALTGSQKALSLPTGLGIVCALPSAIEASKIRYRIYSQSVIFNMLKVLLPTPSKSTRVFFDWADYLKFYETGSYWPYTPSSQVTYAAISACFSGGFFAMFFLFCLSWLSTADALRPEGKFGSAV